ncbi:MAG: amidohydrolase family protein [Polyangiaceae bacterium]
MAQHGMGLVWSPRSNVFLYGAGTDYTKTSTSPRHSPRGFGEPGAVIGPSAGVRTCSTSFRFANQVDDSAWGNVLTAKQLFEMVTVNAARALGLSSTIGLLAAGKKADLFVIGGDPSQPYHALIGAEPRGVRLVMVGGRTLYGDTQVQALAPTGPVCEPLPVCGVSKFLCVAESGGTATNKLGQTLADVVQALSNELSAYDARTAAARASRPRSRRW